MTDNDESYEAMNNEEQAPNDVIMFNEANVNDDIGRANDVNIRPTDAIINNINNNNDIIANNYQQPLLMNMMDVNNVNNDDNDAGTIATLNTNVPLIVLPTMPFISIDLIRDNIISEATARTYLPDIMHFLYWCQQFAVNILTPYCVGVLNAFRSELDGDDADAVRTVVNRSKERFKGILRSANTEALVYLPEITADIFMEYLATLRNTRTNNYLSRSSYSNKRSSLYHLFRCQTGDGFSDLFEKQLSDLFNGFYRVLTTLPEIRRRRGGRGDNDDIENVLNNWNVEEGKEPISVDLLIALCGWLLSLGTQRGLFAHTYVLLTWNLACRTNNTSNIKFNDIVWSTSFDSFYILFRHSKTDQRGDDSKYPRHIFANPNNPVVCPVLSLCMYFTCCFSNGAVDQLGYLFPGKTQERRFSRLLTSTLKDHEEEVNNTYGFQLCRLGPHSFRKGAATFLTSVPGGPPGAAASLRGGWSMGGVKDRYWQYMEAGDHFVGRCLALLPIMSPSFASSPPYFSFDNEADDKFVNKTVFEQFTAVKNVVGFGRLLRMCLASCIYHREWIIANLYSNHIFVTGAHALNSDEVKLKLIEKPDLVVVTYPWNDDVHQFSGIPPHVALLQEITVLRSQQTQLVDGFVDRIREALSSNGYGPNRLTTESLQRILTEFKEEFQLHVQRTVVRVADAEQQNRDINSDRVENGKTYKAHFYLGLWHRVPIDWRFPKCNTLGLWRQWWTGNDRTHVPPLMLLDIKDCKHIDNLPLSEEEIGRKKPGPANKFIRRKADKDIADMRFLMRAITKLVQDKGVEIPKIITTSVVDGMFAEKSDQLVVGARDEQKQWLSVVSEMRRKNKAAK